MTTTSRLHLHATAAARVTRRRAGRPRQGVRVSQVDRRVLAVAKRLAHGDLSRLVIESPTSVLVLSHPRTHAATKIPAQRGGRK